MLIGKLTHNRKDMSNRGCFCPDQVQGSSKQAKNNEIVHFLKKEKKKEN